MPPQETSVTEALRMLMQALQNEADPFIKLLHIFTKGGKGWDEVRSTIDRVYDTVYAEDAPAASPADKPDAEQDDGPVS